MDAIAVVLASLLALGSPVGVVVDKLAADAIRDQLVAAEALQVRVDNASTLQLLNGRLERVRIAGQGLYPVADFRINRFALESDPIDVSIGALRRGEIALDRPLQAAMHLELREADLNQFLQSAWLQQQLQALEFALPGQTAREANRYEFTNPRLALLPDNRLQLALDLQDTVSADTLPIELEVGVAIASGHQLQLLDPVLTVDGQVVPAQVLRSLLGGMQSRLSLRQLEDSGIGMRVLQFAIQDNSLDIVMFVKVEPSSPWLME
ncbi:hypothetical protein XM38_034760 [Halomicronema hongdechloris C2206]|uniref:DUF2993 domain-containing protein n=1 Tax=Halomicronema hongdechloris C2206 TaxID=1641165 RepID=A0A1Z3HQE5_9CYAN|nr:DUF2993 domain-containing protein [Halomicronema hongdechloris]ASC72518.1 hypothetical protein XM38_034760 [Halomicronema hongdechloris C2206]